MRCIVFRVVKKNMDFLDVSCIYFPSKTAPLNLAGTLSNKKCGDHHSRAVPSPQRKKLVGGLEHFLFFHILGIIIPTDFRIFQRDWNHLDQRIRSSLENGLWCRSDILCLSVTEVLVAICRHIIGPVGNKNIKTYYWVVRCWLQTVDPVICNHQHYSMQTTQLYYIVSWS